MREATRLYEKMRLGKAGETPEEAERKLQTRRKWIMTKLIYTYWEKKGRNQEPLFLLLDILGNKYWEYLTTPEGAGENRKTKVEEILEKKRLERTEVEIKTEDADWMAQVDIMWTVEDMISFEAEKYLSGMEAYGNLWREEEQEEVMEIIQQMQTRSKMRNQKERTREEKREYYMMDTERAMGIMKELEKEFQGNGGGKVTLQHRDFFVWAMIQPTIKMNEGKTTTPYVMQTKAMIDMMEDKQKEPERKLTGKEVAELLKTVDKKEIKRSLEREEKRERDRRD